MYRVVHDRFWTDPKVRSLDSREKLLFLYFITSPHSHVSGLYYIPLVTVSHETGMKPSEVARCLSVLTRLHLVFYDELMELVWVKNMLKIQYNRSNSKIVQSVCNQLHNFKDSDLIKPFLELYQSYKKSLPCDMQDTSMSIPKSEPQISISNSSGTETEKELELEKDPKGKPNRSSRAFLSMPNFEEEDQKRIQERKALLNEQAKKLGVKEFP